MVSGEVLRLRRSDAVTAVRRRSLTSQLASSDSAQTVQSAARRSVSEGCGWPLAPPFAEQVHRPRCVEPTDEGTAAFGQRLRRRLRVLRQHARVVRSGAEGETVRQR